MYHRTRWTPKKIGQLLDLITPLVYIRKKSLPSFRFREPESALTPPPIDVVVDVSAWQKINAHEDWGLWTQNIILRTTLQIT